ncbi:MAG: hypothetical protein U1E56_00950 [Bauldia sp.]
MKRVVALALAAGLTGWAGTAFAELIVNSQKSVGGSSQTYTTGADGFLAFPGPSTPPTYSGLQRTDEPVYLPKGFLSPPPPSRPVTTRRVIRYN